MAMSTAPARAPPPQPGTAATRNRRVPAYPHARKAFWNRYRSRSTQSDAPTHAASDAAPEQRRPGNHGDGIVIIGRNATPTAPGSRANGQVATNMPGNGFDIVGTRLSFTRNTGDQSRWKNARDHCCCPCKVSILPRFSPGHRLVTAMSPATGLPPLPGHVQADWACTTVSATRLADARVASPATATESGALSTARPISSEYSRKVLE